MLRSKRAIGLRPPSTCGKSDENMHTSSPAFAIVQPVSSCGYGVTRTWRCTYSLGRRSIGLQPRLVLAERLVRGVERAHPARDPGGAELDDADAQRRIAHEHTVDDQRVQRLHHRERDREVVDRLEVRVAAVEVGHRRQAVVEEVGRHHVRARAGDVQHDGHTRLRARGPHRFERDVTRRVARPGTGRSRSPRCPRRSRRSSSATAAAVSPTGTTVTGSSRGSTEHQSSTARCCARAIVTASSWSPSRSKRSACGLVNVSNTSWLAKPSRSSAAARSSFRNEPVARKFLRSVIWAASVGAVRRVAVQRGRALDRVERRRVLVGVVPDEREPLAASGRRGRDAASRPAP